MVPSESPELLNQLLSELAQYLEEHTVVYNLTVTDVGLHPDDVRGRHNAIRELFDKWTVLVTRRN
jgi:hypothetical protein